MSKPSGADAPPAAPSGSAAGQNKLPPAPLNLQFSVSASRTISRGDSLLWERESKGQIDGSGQVLSSSPKTPTTPTKVEGGNSSFTLDSPKAGLQLSTSLSVSDAEDRFRTSTLLNGTGTQHFSSSPMSASYMGADKSLSPSRGVSSSQERPTVSRTFPEDQSSATSLLSKAFTIRTEDIISNSPNRTMLGSSFFPEGQSGRGRSGSTFSRGDHNRDELCAMSKFSSTLILEHVRHIGEHSDASVQCDEFEGATMIVDVSGFTKMCEEFGKGGGERSKKMTKSQADDGGHTTAATFATSLYRFNNEQELAGSGGEKVREVLETIMGGIIHVVDEHGGDVLRVAGDAVIAVFHAGKKKHLMEADLADCCCRCAFECIELMEDAATIEKVGRKMVLHIGISSGTLDSYHVGTMKGDFQNVVTGPAFDQVGQALVLAGAGEVVVHRRTASLLKVNNWNISFVPTNEEYASHQYRTIQITASKAATLLKKSISALEYIPPPLERQAELRLWLEGTNTPSMTRVMKRYTPLPVRSNASMENAGMLGEIRRATVMFVSIESDFLRKGTIYQRLQRLQKIFEILQDNVMTYRGIVKEFSVDDKGLVLVSGFGIPPHVGLTPPTRACLCSIALLKELHSYDVEAYIGVTTGSVYAGSVGSKTRREFAMVGDTVNLAARLMVAAKKPIWKLKEMSPEYLQESEAEDGIHRPPSNLEATARDFVDLQGEEQEDTRQRSHSAPESSVPSHTRSRNPFKKIFPRQLSPPALGKEPSSKKGKRKPFAKKVQDMVKKTVHSLSHAQHSILHHRHSSDANKLDKNNFLVRTQSGRVVMKHDIDGDDEDKDIYNSDQFMMDKDATTGRKGKVGEEDLPPGRITPSTTVEDLIVSFVKTANREDHVPLILVDGATAAEVKASTKLFFHSLPDIQVKGKQDPVKINLIFSIDLHGDDKSAVEVGRQNFLSAPRYKSITDLITHENEGDSPTSPTLARGESIPDSPGKKTLSLSFIYQDTFLSFSQFRMVLPMVLGGTSVDLPLEDLCWIRTKGIPLYARTFGDELEAADRLFVDEDGNLSFGEMDLSFMLEIASAVPSKVQRSISSLVARLDSTMQIILKVVCVAGGNSMFEQLLALLENVKPFCLFWDSLCKADAEEPDTLMAPVSEDRGQVGGPDTSMEEMRANMRKQLSAPLASKRQSYDLNFASKKDPKMVLRDSKLTNFRKRGSVEVAEIPPLPPKGQGVGEEVGKKTSEGTDNGTGGGAVEGAGAGKGQGIGDISNEEEFLRSRGEEILRRTLKLLDANTFLSFKDGVVTLNDMFMVDTVCSTIPFKQRMALHEYIAQWHKDQTKHDIGERMKRFPTIVHHYVMANKEERASAELMMLNLLGGDFIDKWVLKQVRPMIPTMIDAEKYEGHSADDTDLLARCILALPAIPWLRGLAKAIRGQQVGSVLIKIAARFKTFFDSFRKRKREGSLKRVYNSITSVNYMSKNAAAEGANSEKDLHASKVVASKEEADKKSETLKAERRESRTKQIRQMRRSSSSIIVDASMKAKLQSLSMGNEEEAGGTMTPTRVQFAIGKGGGEPGSLPGLGRSSSEK